MHAHVCIHVFLILKLEQIKGVCKSQAQGASQTITETLRLADCALTSVILEMLRGFLPPGLCSCQSLYMQCIPISFI